MTSTSFFDKELDANENKHALSVVYTIKVSVITLGILHG
jgi:hypothetical protein